MNPQMFQQMQQMMNNPVGMLMKKGFNIPPNVQFNSPKDIVMYLVNSGQVDEETLNQGQSLANQFGYKI